VTGRFLGTGPFLFPPIPTAAGVYRITATLSIPLLALNPARLADARGGFAVLDCNCRSFPRVRRQQRMTQHPVARRRLGMITLERVLLLAAVIGIVTLIVVSLV